MKVSNPFKEILTSVRWFDDTNPATTTVVTADEAGREADTSNIDDFRQGVEISCFKHFGSGIVKIHMGEPGHQHYINSAGMNRRYSTTPTYVERARINPSAYVTNNESGTIDSEIDNENFCDGALEPLSIRSVAGFFHSDYPDRHVIDGSVAFGEDDLSVGDDSGTVVSIYGFNVTAVVPRFDDAIEQLNTPEPLQMDRSPTYFALPLVPFVDRRDELDVSHQSELVQRLSYAGTGMLNVIRIMSGSRDFGLVSLNSVAASAGQTYDGLWNNGVDSIAFGGKTY